MRGTKEDQGKLKKNYRKGRKSEKKCSGTTKGNYGKITRKIEENQRKSKEKLKKTTQI